MTDFLAVLAVALAAGITTVLLRAFPFLILSRLKKYTSDISYFGRMLTPATIIMLVVYCLGDYYKAAAPQDMPHIVAPAAATLFVIFLQWTVRKSLLSVFAGTGFYIFLIQYLG